MDRDAVEVDEHAKNERGHFTRLGNQSQRRTWFILQAQGVRNVIENIIIGKSSKWTNLSFKKAALVYVCYPRFVVSGFRSFRRFSSGLFSRRNW